MGLGTQAWRFIVTGGLAAVVDLGILSVLQLVVGMPPAGARAVSFTAGTTTAYLINRRWTFRASPSGKRFLSVVVLYVLTFAVNYGLHVSLDALFTGWGWAEAQAMVTAFVIAQGTATVLNFIVQRWVIFRQ